MQHSLSSHYFDLANGASTNGCPAEHADLQPACDSRHGCREHGIATKSSLPCDCRQETANTAMRIRVLPCPLCRLQSRCTLTGEG